MNGSSMSQNQQQQKHVASSVSSSSSSSSTTSSPSPSATTITIRPYQQQQPSDETAVQRLYCSSMGTHHSIVFRTILTSYPVGHMMLAYWILCLAMTIAVVYTRSSESFMTTIDGYNLGLAVSLIVAFILPVLALSAFVDSQIFRPALAQAVQTDLSNISTVYAHPGGFWVAQDVSTGTILGCVGAQHHPDDNQESKDGMVFELRRMCVDKNTWNRGVGQRLIQALEHHIVSVTTASSNNNNNNNKKKNPTLLFLTCMQFQHAAHALYEKSGFQLKESKGLEDKQVAFRHLMVIRRYEKQL